MTQARVVAVHRSGQHSFSKGTCEKIEIVAGFGVRGDAHAGRTVQHLSRVRVDPTKLNLRQVHLIHCELFEELGEAGFLVRPGELGENISTSGINLLSLGRGDRLHLGKVILKVTGLRNPCTQIEAFQPGLLKQLAVRHGNEIIRKAGIMTIAESGGSIMPGDPIAIETAPGPHVKLERV